jgi:hypothetical protein
VKLDAAIAAAVENLATAANVLQRIRTARKLGQTPDRTDAALLCRTLELTTCAAREIDARTAGQAEPRRGD